MKIIVMSDTHSRWRDAVDIIHACKVGCDLVIHLGDTIRDLENIKSAVPDVNIVGVLGNNDFFAPSYPKELTLDLDGVRTFICHGHEYGVKFSTQSLKYKALEKECTLALFGHTHMCEKSLEDGVLLFNPGAVKDGKFGVIHIKDGALDADFYTWDFSKGKIL